MKTNFRLSSKMHLFIIISTALIVIGLLVGIVCQCVANGFFNYGEDYSNYKSITVTYENTDFSGNEEVPVEIIKSYCDDAFSKTGVSSYEFAEGETTTGGTVTYKFAYSTDNGKLEDAKRAINEKLAEFVKDDTAKIFNSAIATSAETLLGGGKTVAMAAIAISVAIVFHFIYFVIRYKLTMALGAILADLHNLGLFIALMALTRIPVGSSIATFAVITVLLTVIGTCFLFDRMRKNFKDEELKKLTAFEIVDKTADESFVINTVMPACLATVSVIAFVLLSISSLSPLAIISPVLCSFIGFISCAYGTSFFVPSVYARFKLLGDGFKKKSRSKTAKSTQK
ncbi:MAG: hypothetical protein K2O89_01460 [Clostridia bacterium]|nr:hypothetical protein [Clostridia bacterium]